MIRARISWKRRKTYHENTCLVLLHQETCSHIYRRANGFMERYILIFANQTDRIPAFSRLLLRSVPTMGFWPHRWLGMWLVISGRVYQYNAEAIPAPELELQRIRNDRRGLCWQRFLMRRDENNAAGKSCKFRRYLNVICSKGRQEEMTDEI